jgi:hypothetical protein
MLYEQDVQRRQDADDLTQGRENIKPRPQNPSFNLQADQ